MVLLNIRIFSRICADVELKNLSSSELTECTICNGELKVCSV